MEKRELNKMHMLDRKIMECIFNYKNGVTRAIICKMLNRAWTTIYDHLVILETNGQIIRFSLSDGKRGRPNVFWQRKNYN